MKYYTIGIYFDNNFKKVVLMNKNRPEWQKGLCNFPGGHIENETAVECIEREFKEETGLEVNRNDWMEIGVMKNSDIYNVRIFTAVQKYYHGTPKTMEDQQVFWATINKLPKNVISNLPWLIHFAFNFLKQGNADNLKYGVFEYENTEGF